MHNSECKNFWSFYQEKEHHIMVNEIIDKMLVHSALYIIWSQISFDMRKNN